LNQAVRYLTEFLHHKSDYTTHRESAFRSLKLIERIGQRRYSIIICGWFRPASNNEIRNLCAKHQYAAQLQHREFERAQQLSADALATIMRKDCAELFTKWFAGGDAGNLRDACARLKMSKSAFYRQRAKAHDFFIINAREALDMLKRGD